MYMYLQSYIQIQTNKQMKATPSRKKRNQTLEMVNRSQIQQERYTLLTYMSSYIYWNQQAYRLIRLVS